MEQSSLPYLLRHCHRDEKGILRPRTGVASVAYPEESRDPLFAVEDFSFWFGHRNDVIAAMVAKWPPAGPLVDIGGGNGFVSKRLQDEGYETLLVEPGPVGALNAVERGVRHIFCGLFGDLALPDDSLGGAGLFDTLEHIEAPATLLAETHAALQNNGYLYITVPASPALWSTADDQACHFRRYTPQTLARELKAARFEILYLSPFFTFLYFPILFLRALPWRLGLSGSKEAAPYRPEKAHRPGAGAAIAAFLSRGELAVIKKGWPLPAGSSLLAVARKSTA